MSTNDNLQEAFAGESQANRRYLAFAKKAEDDDLPGVAKLFRAAAEAETVHALAHLRVLDTVQETEDNLKAAIEGEGHEFKVMYPPFLALAQQEGNHRAEMSFKYALAVEEIHYRLYSEALAAVQAGKDMEIPSIHICEICGNTVIGDVPDRCPICNAARARFVEID
ncbi:MAG: rubrerythrin family protein [FCB group bacterium]|jgi:rubrerythrin|nr:rubrerythrin family protein [FCB group bacterium]